MVGNNGELNLAYVNSKIICNKTFTNNGVVNLLSGTWHITSEKFTNAKGGEINVSADAAANFVPNIEMVAYNYGTIRQVGVNGAMRLMGDSGTVNENVTFNDHGLVDFSDGHVEVSGSFATYNLYSESTTRKEMILLSNGGILNIIMVPPPKPATKPNTNGSFSGEPFGSILQSPDAGGSAGASNYRVLVHNLNFRYGPGMGFGVAGQIPMNTMIEVTAIENGWARWTTASGQQVWSSLAYLVPMPSVAKGQTMRTTANLNLRAAPGVDGGVITVAPRGSSVTVIGVFGSWAQVEYNGIVGYMSLAYLG